MALHIVWDFSERATVPAGAVILQKLQDWLQHRRAIENAAASRRGALIVVVRSQELSAYLKGYRVSYGANVTEEDADPVAQVGRLLGFVPEDLDEEIVVEARLLDGELPHGLSLEDLALNRLFGTDIFGQPAVDRAATTELLCALCRRPALLDKPFVYRGVRNNLQVWQRNGSEVARCLVDHGLGIAGGLLVRLLLASYPEPVLQRALRNRDLVPEVPPEAVHGLSTLPMPAPLAIPTPIRTRLETLVYEALRTLPLPRYLSSVSGVLKVELDVLTERLSNSVDAVPLEALRDKFEPLIAAGHGDALEKLGSLWAVKRQLVFPCAKAAALEAWPRVKEFFVNRSVPAWRAGHGPTADNSLRERLVEVDEEYAEWLLSHYFDLSLGEASPLSDRVMQRTIHRLRDQEVIVIWLILDCVSWEAMDRIVRPAARSLGGAVIGEEACIAALPTITNVAMLSLVALSPLEAIFPESQCELWGRMMGQSWKHRKVLFGQQFPTGVYRTIRGSGDVIKALATESSLYCLVFGEIDAEVHRDTDSVLFDRYQQGAIEGVIRWVYEAINATDMHRRAGNGIRLLITSDHGWTDVCRGEPVGLPQYLGTAGLVEPSHNRILVLRGDRLDEETLRALEPEWYVVSGPRFRLPKQLVFLLPKRLAPIAGKNRRMHGGASMMETIVPLLEVAVSQPSWLPLVATLDAANLVAGDQGRATVTVKNPNEADVPKALVRIDALSVWQEIGPIPRRRTAAFDIPVLPSRSGRHALDGLIEYETTAAKRCDPFTATVVVQQSEAERMAGTHQIDSLFDEFQGG